MLSRRTLVKISLATALVVALAGLAEIGRLRTALGPTDGMGWRPIEWPFPRDGWPPGRAWRHRDGTEVGPNIEATARLGRETQVPVIASGGVGTLAHLAALTRAGSGIVGAIVGRALHEGRFSLDEAVQAAKNTAPA